MSFLDELSQRRVIRITGLYLAGAFAVLQGAQLLIQSLHLPDVILTVLTVAALIILPIVIATVAWDNKRAFAFGTAGVVIALAGIGAYAYARHDDVDKSAASSNSANTVPSIAVLPFRNMSDDKEQEYFSDGLTEELLNSLAQLQNLRVAARTSSFAYKNKDVPVGEIGKTLNVGHLLEGSVRRAGNKLRITAQLIKTSDGYHIWSKTYDRNLTDVFGIQEEIANAITDALKIALGSKEETKVEQHDVDAYNLYLQARYFWNKRSPEGITKARGLLEQAVQKDPQYARAWSALADVYSVSAEYTDMPIAQANAGILKSARRAIELDSTLAEPHATIGNHYAHEFDWKRSYAEFERAIALNPNYATAHQWFAWTKSAYGDLAGAVKGIEIALKLDPLSQIINTNYGQHLSVVGRMPDAIAQLRKTVELAPDFALAKATLAGMLVLDGKQAEALKLVDEIMSTAGPQSRHTLGYVAYVYAAGGRRGDALRIARTFDNDPRGIDIAPAYIALGDTARAFRLIESSIAVRDPATIIINGYPTFDPIRNTAHFRQIRRLMKR